MVEAKKLFCTLLMQFKNGQSDCTVNVIAAGDADDRSSP